MENAPNCYLTGFLSPEVLNYNIFAQESTQNYN